MQRPTGLMAYPWPQLVDYVCLFVRTHVRINGQQLLGLHHPSSYGHANAQTDLACSNEQSYVLPQSTRTRPCYKSVVCLWLFAWPAREH